jgi:hypothetical protein
LKLHLYCVRRAGDPAPPHDLTGIGSATVRLLEFGDLGLWVSEGGAVGGADVEHLRQHDRVVREALRTATPVPMRFGQRLGGESAVRDLLSERRDEFLRTLRRIEDRVEMGVQVGGGPEATPRVEDAAEPPDPEGISRGLAYLEGRRRKLAAKDALHRAAEERLEEAAREFASLGLPTVRTTLGAPGLAGSLAHLVHRRELRPYRKHALEAQRRRPDLGLTFSGPWAPYSFVSHGTH